MFDPSRMLEQMVRSGFGKTKKRKKRGGFGGGAIGGLDALAHRAGVPGGSLGLLGGLAIAAFEHLNQQRSTGTAGPGHMPPPTVTPPPPPPPGRDAPPRSATPPPPPPPPGAAASPLIAGGTAGAPGERGSAVVVEEQPDRVREKATLLIEAMIEAAKADGVIDPDERAKILDRLAEGGLGAEERSFVEARMALPPAPDRLIAKVAPEDPANRLLAAEVYVVSLLAIEVDTPAEREYLRALGKRLQLDDAVIGHLHDDLGVERP